jgi:23S rRNA pseudouridine1911/1915/1917 synthase
MSEDSNKNNQTINIPDELANERLDQALAKLLPQYSRTQIKQWIESDQVTLNGDVVKAKTKVKFGDIVIVQPTERPEPVWQAQKIPLNIVHEDESILIINKSAGMVVHPGAGNADSTLLNALLHHAPELKLLPRAGILHRLDKDTTGLLIIAKTAEALKDLLQQLKKRTMVREYQAVVYGELISGGKVDAPIDRHHLQRKRMAVSDTGKTAVTHYRVMEKYRNTTRLKVKLETGRTHQIRVHLSHIRYPIVGDVLYGGRVQLAKGMSEELILCLRQFKRQALHAFALGFTHPATQEWMEFSVDIPADMEHLVNVLRADAKGIKK